jgi:hypothetical protein
LREAAECDDPSPGDPLDAERLAWEAVWTAKQLAYMEGFRSRRLDLVHWPSGREAGLIRCIVGNPFRPVALDPTWLAWNDKAVVKLAQAAYDQRLLPSGELDLARLAVLADALEEAGCSESELLTHLRGPGPHVRGCWVVDLLLGKA